MHSDLLIFVFVATAGAFLAGVYAERFRARRTRQAWRNSRRGGEVVPLTPSTGGPTTDAADQLRIVMGATFAKRPLLAKAEAKVLYAAERAIQVARLKWRVMAQVSLGEILSCPDSRAYSTINSKRVDLLVVSGRGEPIAAIEYHGSGHYQGTAPARDAVKKEALRRAGVRYIEITPEHDDGDVAREISRLVCDTNEAHGTTRPAAPISVRPV